jgi:hypothetical protein
VIKIKFDLEKILLIAFFTIFLFAGNGNLFDNKLKHEFPYAYLASDAFQHQVRAQSIKDAGNYKNEASYIVFGIEGAIGYYPPVLYHLSSILSYLSGLEVYDTIYFIVFLFASLASLLMYLIIKQFNTHIAIISLPISLLVFSSGLYSGFTWGHWPTLLSQFFLICIFWYTSRVNLEKSFIFLGVFISASFMTHTSEALFAVIYLILFFIVSSIINTKIKFDLLNNILLGGIISFFIIFYYLVIFKYVWIPRQPFVFAVSQTWDNPTMYLIDFKLLFLSMIAGAIISIFFIKKSLVPALASFTMLLIGLGNYYGFREKAFQLRFFWPIFLSFLIALGIYQILRLVIKDWKFVYSVIISVLIISAIFINNIPFIPHYNKLKTNGLMDIYHWSSFQWIGKNTEKSSKIYFFYGDIYSQDAILRNTKRAHSQVIPEDFVDAIKNRQIRRFYDTEVPGDGGGGAPYRKSFFSFGFYLNELLDERFSGKKDICNFNYIIFDKVSRQQVFAQYNLLIADKLLKKDYISKVFENDVVVILKNNKIGDDCIEDGSF